MNRFVFALILVLGVSASAVYAADEGRFALVIGNAAYDGDMALGNPANDAEAVSQALASVGWNVTKLLNGDRKSMNRTIAQFRDVLAAEKSPTAMLFYAGHGMQIGGVNYLIPVKEVFETPDDVVNDAISLNAILSSFDDAKVSTNIVILDACRDNPFVKKNTRSLGGTRGLSVVQKSTNVEGSAVLFATAPGDTAADGTGDNGVFTTALLKYLTTDISIQVMAARVTGEVKRLTGGKQTPYSSLSLSDEFFVVPASLRGAAAPATAAEVPRITTQPVRTVQPQQDQAQVVKAALIVEKQTLVQKRQEIRDSGSWAGWLGGLGWGVAALGGGMSGWGYFEGTEALKVYNNAQTQQGFDGARDQMQGASTKFQYGLYTLGGGAVLGVLSLFLGPNTSSVDAKIQDVEKRITLLGAN